MVRVLLVAMLLVGLGSWLSEEDGEHVSMDEETNTTLESAAVPREEEPVRYTQAPLIRVEVKRDWNITKETNLTLEANVVTDAPRESLDCIWKVAGSVVGGGDSLRRSFPLGEHRVEFEVYRGAERVAYEAIKVTAWNYLKEEKFYYDTEWHDFERFELNVYNHRNRTVFSQNRFARMRYRYNERDQIMEHTYEDLEDCQYNYSVLYTYDREYRLLLVERLDYDSNLISRQEYNEEGTPTYTESDTVVYQEYAAHAQDSSERTFNEKGQLVSLVSTLQNGSSYRMEIAYDNDRIAQRKIYIDNHINTRTFAYDPEGRVTQEAFERTDSTGTILNNNRRTITYNAQGERLTEEFLYKVGDQVMQHTMERWEYTPEARVARHEVEALKGFCPGTVDTVRESTRYRYDQHNRLIARTYQSQSEGDASPTKERTTMKVIRTYINSF